MKKYLVGLLVITTTVVGAVAFLEVKNSTSPTLEGYAVMTENTGLEMTAITYQEYEPLSMGGDFELPSTISTGDKIKVTYDGSILETFPGQLSNVSKVKIIEEGDSSNIPEGILDIFKEYGREVIE